MRTQNMVFCYDSLSNLYVAQDGGCSTSSQHNGWAIVCAY